MCEASFVEGGDNPPDLHLTGAEAASIAAQAGAKTLLLTHIPPGMTLSRVERGPRPFCRGPVLG
ncbi:MAG: hypothetical protein R2709_07005 [Marmoricola sp.]